MILFSVAAYRIGLSIMTSCTSRVWSWRSHRGGAFVSCTGRAWSYFPRKVMSSLYYSLFYHYLVYWNIVWRGTYCAMIDKLFLLQKKIILIMFNANYPSHRTPLLFQFKILKVADILDYFLLCMYMYKRKLRGDPGRPDHAHGTYQASRWSSSTYQRLTLT